MLVFSLWLVQQLAAKIERMISVITVSPQSTLSSFKTGLMHMEHLPPATCQIARQPALGNSNMHAR